MKMFTLLTVDVNDQEFEAVQAENSTEGLADRHVETRTEESGDKGAANPQPQQQGSGWSMWIMLALIFGVMWFFMIRPQRKQQKELQKFREGLKKGDKIVTIGGIYGTIVEVKDASALIEVDNGVKIRVSKQALIKDFSESQQ
jgi:preprotein translocase subunit YajC